MGFDYIAHLGDTAYLQKLINENDEIVIPCENPLTGDTLWLIRRRLVLDSGKTVILDGAHLRLDDGIFEQFFSTEPEMGMDQTPKENIKIIGKNGALLKIIGSRAREDIEDFFGTKVFLDLWVKVKENWRNSDVLLNNFGFANKDDE